MNPAPELFRDRSPTLRLGPRGDGKAFCDGQTQDRRHVGRKQHDALPPCQECEQDECEYGQLSERGRPLERESHQERTGKKDG